MREGVGFLPSTRRPATSSLAERLLTAFSCAALAGLFVGGITALLALEIFKGYFKIVFIVVGMIAALKAFRLVFSDPRH